MYHQILTINIKEMYENRKEEFMSWAWGQTKSEVEYNAHEYRKYLKTVLWV